MIQDALEFLKSYKRAEAESAARNKAMEINSQTPCKDYKAALNVWVEFLDSYAKSPSDYEHFSTWLLRKMGPLFQTPDVIDEGHQISDLEKSVCEKLSKVSSLCSCETGTCTGEHPSGSCKLFVARDIIRLVVEGTKNHPHINTGHDERSI
jgi:hypothetical protein